MEFQRKHQRRLRRIDERQIRDLTRTGRLPREKQERHIQKVTDHRNRRNQRVKKSIDARRNQDGCAVTALAAGAAALATWKGWRA